MRYSKEQAEELQQNVILVHQEIRDALNSLLGEVETSLKNKRAREFLRHGVCRRLQTIRRCISNIFTIFPVGRTEPLDWDDLGDIDINLHAFLINSHGIPDNLAWVYLLERGVNLEPRQIGLFNPKTQAHLPKEVITHVKSESLTRWHAEYAKNYRDALAHQIPPYVAPSALTPEHRAKYEKLEEQILQASKAHDFERALQLMEEQSKCGGVCLAFAQSFLDENACDPVLLHAQLIVDARTVLQIITVMRPHLYLDSVTPHTSAPSLSAQFLLEGAVYALEQAGLLLHGAYLLYKDKQYGSAIVMALFSREEMGRYFLIRQLRRNMIENGRMVTAQDVRQACDNHMKKQEQGDFGSVQVFSPGERAHDVFISRSSHHPGSSEYQRLDRLLRAIVKEKKDTQPQRRHQLRMKALYVDLADSEETWSLPKNNTKSEAQEEIRGASNAYSFTLDQFIRGDDYRDEDPTFYDDLQAWSDRPLMPNPLGRIE